MKALVLHYKLDENVSFGFSASEAPLYRVSQQVWNRLRNVSSDERILLEHPVKVMLLIQADL